MKRYILLLFLVLLPITAATAELHITPSLCAVGEDETSCNVSVKVAFSADEDDVRYCLSVVGKGLIRCFWGDTDKDLQVYINSEQDIQFTVTEGETGAPVAAATLVVAQYHPKRHRRRYGWGLL
ncbi:DUF3019 domain-containing protein [Microbulbifer bruguierae]|uniref:DUF3019 domain-containing protein n=1 Tax=Microbulbifer bruguierae TaxID=3029061 RepID=A0ABY8N9H8_9GAMM|nr:DUF3019 domain-containing protein [Microbulbifer bruguierae]WGL15556.1 DUF3019 domain-containing protein [Microbulbifer bruguierae]